jgi:cell division protein FtsW
LIARASRAGKAAPLGGGNWARGDAWLLIVPGILLTAGLLMIYSASAGVAKARHGDAAYYFTHQARWALVGLVALATGAWVDYHRWRRLIVPLTLGRWPVMIVSSPGGPSTARAAGSRRRGLGAAVGTGEAGAGLCSPYLVKRADAIASFRGLAPALAVVGAGIGNLDGTRSDARSCSA